MKLKTPFREVLPPLSSTERETLKADIKKNGVLNPVIIDEDGNVLDGHNRYEIDKNAPTIVVEGLSESEKLAFVIRSNMNRRNLSPTQKAELLKQQKQIAGSLREQDAKKWTQKRVAEVLGVGRQTVSDWFNATNAGSGKSCKPDARVKINKAAKEEIKQRLAGGETQTQVAADYGVTRQAVAKVAKEQQAIHSRDEDKARKTAHLENSLFDVRRGDFRDVLRDVNGVSLVLTDPPYPKESLDLWVDLSEWASKALLDDGLLIAYSGQMFLPQVIENLCSHLDYWWCGAIKHGGRGNLTPLGFPVRKVINEWKPLLMFYKPGGSGFARTFRDFVSGAGSQKTDHNWQQPVAEAAAIIEAFTDEGDLVVDPFAGSGGFCKAAHDLGRKVIGAEILD